MLAFVSAPFYQQNELLETLSLSESPILDGSEEAQMWIALRA
jgi:hypothetical protein